MSGRSCALTRALPSNERVFLRPSDGRPPYQPIGGCGLRLDVVTSAYGCLSPDRARWTLGGRRPRTLLRDARGRVDDGPAAAAGCGACRARGGARGGTGRLVLLLDRR